MTDQASDETPLLSCEVCLKEIPASETKIAEAEDYVLYFCGIECYDRWHRQATDPENAPAKEP